MPMRNEQVIRDYNARMRSINAEQHKEAARECYEREEASFERSDDYSQNKFTWELVENVPYASIKKRREKGYCC